MDTTNQKSSDGEPQSSDKDSQTAVPYIPPPPPDEASVKKLRSPMVNGIIAAMVILLGGFMAYNGVGHQLTQLESASSVNIPSPTPSVAPTVTLQPSLSPSPAQ